jgi:iodotyrosine deiodinase
MNRPRFIPAPKTANHSDDQLIVRSKEFYSTMKRRRTVRDFSERPVPREVIEHCIRAAGTAPNGANLQPWHFVAVSDPVVKHKIAG